MDCIRDAHSYKTGVDLKIRRKKERKNSIELLMLAQESSMIAKFTE